MLIQLHHQFKEGHTEMCAQREIDPRHRHKELRSFVEDTKGSHPLPDNAQWLFVTEKSRFFVWAKHEDT